MKSLKSLFTFGILAIALATQASADMTQSSSSMIDGDLAKFFLNELETAGAQSAGLVGATRVNVSNLSCTRTFMLGGSYTACGFQQYVKVNGGSHAIYAKDYQLSGAEAEEMVRILEWAGVAGVHGAETTTFFVPYLNCVRLVLSPAYPNNTKCTFSFGVNY